VRFRQLGSRRATSSALRRAAARAQELLETTDLPVETVAERTGLGNAGNLRKIFRRHVRTTPSSYRATFREEAAPALSSV
jgi:transcriptional regulator GlxA family with amidase domain